MTDEQQQAMNNWHLSDLTIRLETYGKDKGKYTGTARFTNKESEYIALRINQEQAGKFLAIITEDLHGATKDICTNLLTNVRCMIAPPKPVEEIEEEASV